MTIGDLKQPLMLAAVLACSPALAQEEEKPWVLFFDSQSTSACDVVNADNAELVVLQGTGQMVIVSGSDVTLQDVVVDTQGFVTFEGQPAGLIDFALDGDGFRTLWWTSLVGGVARLNGTTGAPSFTENLPEDYTDVACDACDFWDDQTVCPQTPPSICGAGLPFLSGLTFAGLMGLRMRRPTAA